MSFIIENMPTNKVNNKDRDMKEDYSFKYIPESYFKHIVKNVQRQRRKEDEERIWTSFVKEQELHNFRCHKEDDNYSIQAAKNYFDENMLGIDRELKRLEEDALPEGNKETYHHTPGLNDEKTYMPRNSARNDSSVDKVLLKKKHACIKNVRAPVSQTNTVSICKEPEGLQTVFRSNEKKSLSDSSITEKKSCTNELLRVTSHFENNSDTDSNNDNGDIVYVQPDPFMTHKLLSMETKIAELLDEISFRLCKIPLPDGDNDVKRRQQQTLEFAIRFSRNYLYNLNRLVTSIQGHIRVVSARSGLMQYQKTIVFHQDMIKQKLIAAHQLLIQALNAYYKHIPNSLFGGHPTKLQEVLQIVCNLKDICDKIGVTSNYYSSGDTTIVSMGKYLQEKCDAILAKIQYDSENKSGTTSNKNIGSTNAREPVPTYRKKHSRKNLSGRLSMYSMDVQESRNNQKKKKDLRRKSCIWQRENGNNLKSIKNMNSQHNSLPELLYPSPVTRNSSSRDTVQIHPVKSMNYFEDDIRTMMDALTTESENDSNVELQGKNKIASTSEQRIATNRRESRTELKTAKEKEMDIKEECTPEEDNSMDRVTTIAKAHLTTLAPVISDLMAVVSKKANELEEQPLSDTSMETLREFLQKYYTIKESNSKAFSANYNCARSRCKSNSISQKQKRGENVQLICVSPTATVPKTARRCDASCQADYDTSFNKIGGTKTRCSGRNGVIELTVSKETELKFLTFKEEYKNLCQSRPMYSSNTQNKPWDIVSWISDQLMEELIAEVTEELQMSDIIKKLFEMEFQEF